MWSYYGAKTNLVDLYPKPKTNQIIEPFAGSARYSLKHFEKDVLLIDKYPIVVKLWKWLQQCSPNDILKLPRKIDHKQRFDEMQFDCEEARLLMSFVTGSGDARPRSYPTARKTVDRPNHLNYNLQRIAKNLFKIKHWQIIEGNYTVAPNITATWFIDPPYQVGGNVYAMSNKQIDFSHLAQWSKERQGQVIVCENTKAEWLPFNPLIKQRGSLFTTTEAIWTNVPTIYNYSQSTLL